MTNHHEKFKNTSVHEIIILIFVFIVIALLYVKILFL